MLERLNDDPGAFRAPGLAQPATLVGRQRCISEILANRIQRTQALPAGRHHSLPSVTTDDGLPCLAVSKGPGEHRVAKSEDAHSKQRSVAAIANSYRGNRNAIGHLHNRQKRVNAV